MEFLRYLLVFVVIGWVGGLIGFVFFAVLRAALRRMRDTNAGRVLVAAANGTAVFLSVLLAARLCDWTGGAPKSAMFLLAFVAMVMNDVWRINRMKTAATFGGQILDENEGLRVNLVLTERLNAGTDLVGFALGLWVLPSMPFA